jgi:hypothetical protein
LFLIHVKTYTVDLNKGVYVCSFKSKALFIGTEVVVLMHSTTKPYTATELWTYTVDFFFSFQEKRSSVVYDHRMYNTVHI